MNSLRKYFARELRTWSPLHFVIDAVVTLLLTSLLSFIVNAMTSFIVCTAIYAILIFIATTLAIILYRKETETATLRILDETDDRSLEGLYAYSVKVKNESTHLPCKMRVRIIDINPCPSNVVLPVSLELLGQGGSHELLLDPQGIVSAILVKHDLLAKNFVIGGTHFDDLREHGQSVQVTICASTDTLSATRKFTLEKYGLTARLVPCDKNS
jgi:hypothetical protein